MALVECRECSKEISKQANICPGCGAKQKSALTPPTGCVIVIAAFFALIVIGRVSTPPPKPTVDQAISDELAKSGWGMEAICNVSLSPLPIETQAYIKSGAAGDGTELFGKTDEQIAQRLDAMPNKNELIRDVKIHIANTLTKYDEILAQHPNVTIPDDCKATVAKFADLRPLAVSDDTDNP
ncbi:MAG: hypothetical protein KGQ42_01450 [Alphaproteobacteria bacterium]|nr:hypothetical protein [Alphaproteobacteria bacterium]